MTKEDDGDDFDFSDLDDPASDVPDTEPNTAPEGTYSCEIMEVRFFQKRSTEERKLVISARICSGKCVGMLLERYHTLEKNEIQYFVKDMDRLGFGKEIRKGANEFLRRIRDENILNGLFCEMEIKVGKDDYKNVYINKKIDRPEGVESKAKTGAPSGDADESNLPPEGGEDAVPEEDMPF